jgi:hypothetical protein
MNDREVQSSCGKIRREENQTLEQEPLPLYPPQIPHVLAWHRAQIKMELKLFCSEELTNTGMLLRVMSVHRA